MSYKEEYLRYIKTHRAWYKRSKKENPWKTHHHAAKTRCVNQNVKCFPWYGGKGIKFLLTMDQVKELWIRDRAYELKKPSLDRIDSNKHYCFENCRFIENNKNQDLMLEKRRRKIVRIDAINRRVIFNSAISAAKAIGKKDSSHIHKCAKGQYPTAYGYQWRYQHAA